MLKSLEVHWSNDSEKKLWLFSNVVVFVLYFYIAICVPYTHDDWDWGLEVGMKQLLHANLNSRYSGNFFVVIMTRFEWIKNIIMGVVAWAIPYVFSKLNGENVRERILYFFLINLFVIDMPVIMWAQTYGWVSGFANYIISLLGIGLFLLICKQYLVTENKKIGIKDIGAFFVVMLTQLFLEHVSIYLFLLSAGLFSVSVMKRKNQKQFALLLSANMFGLLIMFSSSIYGELFSTGVTLSHIEGLGRKFVFSPEDGLGMMIKTVVENFVSVRIFQLWRHFSWLVPVILFLSLWVLWQNRKQSGIKGKVLMVGNILTMLAFVFYMYQQHIAHNYQGLDVSLGLFYLWFHVLICLMLWEITDRRIARVALFFWISAVVVLVPLAAVAERNDRLYLVSYFFIVITVVMQVLYLFRKAKEEEKNKIVIIIGLTVLFLFFMRCVIYTGILQTTLENRNRIEQVTEVQGDSLELVPYDNAGFLWFEYPSTEERVVYYKEFYGIPETVNVTFP
ncbi:MAG: hypothetical protein IJZ00_07625 [Lachnospiraceae bacterium]|nr:hypothetical protein [Lachnospiraceae bacterium]